MGFVSSMLVCDYISGSTGSFSTAFGAHTGIGNSTCIYGNEEQKKKYIPKLASGEWFGAYCLTEPGAGSDANSGKTKAVLSSDKKYYLISGQKCGFPMLGLLIYLSYLLGLRMIKISLLL